MKRLFLLVATVGALAAAAAIPLGQTAAGNDSSALRNALTVSGIQTHLAALQRAADAGGGGNRDEQSAGFQNTVNYVTSQLRSYG